MQTKTLLIIIGVLSSVLVLAGWIGGVAIKHLIDANGTARENLGAEKTAGNLQESENAFLTGALKDTLAEVQSHQAMMRDLVSIDDKTEVGPVGTKLLDSMRANEPPISPGRSAGK